MKNEESIRQKKSTTKLKQTENTYFSFFSLIGVSILLTLSIICSPRHLHIHLSSILWWVEFLAVFTFCFMLIQQTQAFTIYLDKKFNWLHEIRKRIFWQITLGAVVPVTTTFAYHTSIFYLVNSQLPRALFSMNLAFAVLLINAIYALHYIYTFHHINARLTDGEKQKPKENSYMGYSRDGKVLAISYEDIEYFTTEKNTRYLKTVDGNMYPLTDSLKKIDKDLKGGYFFLITRDYIVPRKTIKNPRRNAKRGIEMELNNKVKVDVCRKKTKVFEAWYGQKIPGFSKKGRRPPNTYCFSLLALVNISL